MAAMAQLAVVYSIAKETLDWAVYDGKTIILQTSTPNSAVGIKTALRLLKTRPDW